VFLCFTSFSKINADTGVGAALAVGTQEEKGFF
jgi:hypothetical protein